MPSSVVFCRRPSDSRVLMLYRIRNGLVAIPAAAHLEPVPIYTSAYSVVARYLPRKVRNKICADSVHIVYSQTFFPSAIRLRNTLPADICQLSPDSFKTYQQFPFRLSTGLPSTSCFCRLYCTVFIRSYCSLFAARFSRYTSAYSLVVRYRSESSRRRYRKTTRRRLTRC